MCTHKMVLLKLSLNSCNRLQTHETYEEEDYYLQPHSWGSFERKHKLKNNADRINSNSSNNKTTTITNTKILIRK